MTNPALLLRAFLQPQVLVRGVIRSLSLGSVEFRLAMQALEKAQYAFGIRQAIYLASRLGHSRVAVIEFGVGAGGGLKLMEQYAAELGKSYGVHVEVYGFDLGSGLPKPSSYRDLPYAWRAGDYPHGHPTAAAEPDNGEAPFRRSPRDAAQIHRVGSGDGGFYKFRSRLLYVYNRSIFNFQRPRRTYFAESTLLF